MFLLELEGLRAGDDEIDPTSEACTDSILPNDCEAVGEMIAGMDGVKEDKN